MVICKGRRVCVYLLVNYFELNIVVNFNKLEVFVNSCVIFEDFYFFGRRIDFLLKFWRKFSYMVKLVFILLLNFIW